MNLNKLTDTFVLSNGVEIPCIGYGTWQTPSGDVARDSVKAAIDAGYRHIDTAFAYGNEVDVGEGIKASGVARKDVFITTKHWITERGYQKTIDTFEASLKNLGVDYLDLYLVHWPCVEKVTPDWKEVNAETWRGFEKMYKDGKLRALGVSNYEAKHLEALDEFATVKPMVNQIEFHPGYTQYDNVLYCQNRGMLVQAWSPLGSGAVLKDETLNAMAAKYGKSVAQLCIRFALQCDVLPLPKSLNPARMVQNTEVFDFEIDKDDVKALIEMPLLGFTGWRPEDAPADALVNGD
ncbi:MAG: aldo/keto reductase [Clostridiales bacterium]|nr:aldo/keto reductase [Clostridiales bacterium]